MTTQTALQKVLNFFLTKIIIGIAIVAGAVALVEVGGRILLGAISLSEIQKNVIIVF